MTCPTRLMRAQTAWYLGHERRQAANIKSDTTCKTLQHRSTHHNTKGRSPRTGSGTPSSRQRPPAVLRRRRGLLKHINADPRGARRAFRSPMRVTPHGRVRQPWRVLTPRAARRSCERRRRAGHGEVEGIDSVRGAVSRALRGVPMGLFIRRRLRARDVEVSPAQMCGWCLLRERGHRRGARMGERRHGRDPTARLRAVGAKCPSRGHVDIDHRAARSLARIMVDRAPARLALRTDRGHWPFASLERAEAPRERGRRAGSSACARLSSGTARLRCWKEGPRDRS